MTSHDHPRNDLALAEAALFLAAQPLTRRGLAKILGGVAQAYVDQLLADLKIQFDDPSRGIEVHIEDGRAQFRVKSAYVSEVSHLAPQHDIPRQELRTLAVIAYNHPMTQANLIKIRGNKGYKHVQELIERNLITSEPHGRTCLLRVTRDFLRHFGLNSVDEFRFHFPTAAEENAEALARGNTTDEDIDATDGINNGAGSDQQDPMQEPADTTMEATELNAQQQPPMTRESLTDNEPTAEPTETPDNRDPEEAPDAEEAENSGVSFTLGIESETDEEPSEEVEHG